MHGQAEMIDRNKLQWIFFDVGDTLVDESLPFQSSIEQFVRYAGLLGYTVSEKAVKDGLTEAYTSFSTRPMWQVMEALIPSEEARIQIRGQMKYEKHLEQPFPEAKEVLCRLAEHYKIGIIANQSIGTSDRLENYGLLPYISVVCSSAEAGLSKPDPKFFHMALEEAKCSPEQAVMVGDRIDNDILPAQALGMGTVWVRQGYAREQRIPLSGMAPDIIINRLSEIVGALIRR